MLHYKAKNLFVRRLCSKQSLRYRKSFALVSLYDPHPKLTIMKYG